MKYFIISLIPALVYIIIDSLKAFQILQQNWYNDGNRYLKWIKTNFKKVFISYDLIIIAIYFIGNYINNNILIILFSIYYCIITIFLKNEHKNEQTKKPLDITKRIKRLLCTTIIIYLIIILTICLNYNNESIKIYYLIIGLCIYFNYIIVFIANIINIPIEKLVYLYYKTKAQKKLKSMNKMEVIGITGSYGKTSTKNVLNQILSEKYITLKTPQNFNTNYGLIRTINEYMDKFNDYFIAELGAFRKGDIKQRADLVKPKYGILTKIGAAHLETFGSQENIVNGKFELIESLPENGCAILNKDDNLQTSYTIKNKCNVLWYAIENKTADVYANNIKYSKNGTEFDAYINKNKYTFKTKLLGSKNIYNILAAITLANYLNVSIEQIKKGILKIKPVEHRLELKSYGKINYIDDAYNSNPIGSEMAIEVLNLMPGKKIVITPGMVELGNKQYEYNYEFGKKIAPVADLTILIGEKQTKPIQDGLNSMKYDKNKIITINDVKEAIKIAQNYFDSEVYILLENDLPDIFNEKNTIKQ